MQNQPGYPPAGVPSFPGTAAPMMIPGMIPAAAGGAGHPSHIHPSFAFHPFGTAPPIAAPGATATAAAASASGWLEYKTVDGRPYYFNTITHQTSWENPMKTETERLLDACPWKEYKTEDGKIYYHNVQTQNSSWIIPKELEELKKKLGLKIDSKNDTEQPSTGKDTDESTEQHQKKDDGKSSGEEESSDDDNNDNDESSNSKITSQDPSETKLPSSVPEPVKPPEPSKSDLLELFKEILREKNISSNASWENTLKNVGNDPRFERFRSHPERKQFFNAYKTQRAKEEKEEMKNKMKRAKEALASFLRRTDRMNSMIRYRHACEMFRDHEHWKVVPEQHRREIFDEALEELARKEREEAKQLQKRNMLALSDILDSMPKITYRTTWQEAQQLLLDNPTFSEDSKLLAMDKEDALLVFEQHIRSLESDEEEEKARTKRIQLRQQRLNREAFIQLLDEFHASGKLNSLSKWCKLYSDISSDSRFEAMLSQPLSGSTPLDLFKFYVENLKSRFKDEKIMIKDILKRQHFIMTPDTEFPEFATVLSKDPRSATLDSGNVKLMHEKLLEKEREIFREKRREEMKSRRRLESQFLELLSRLPTPLTEHSDWNEIRPLICHEEAFHLLPNEEDRISVFESAKNSIVERCSHHHNHKSGHHRHRCRINKTSGNTGQQQISGGNRKKRNTRSPSNSSIQSATGSLDDTSDSQSCSESRSSASSASSSSSSMMPPGAGNNDHRGHGHHHRSHGPSSPPPPPPPPPGRHRRSRSPIRDHSPVDDYRSHYRSSSRSSSRYQGRSESSKSSSYHRDRRPRSPPPPPPTSSKYKSSSSKYSDYPETDRRRGHESNRSSRHGPSSPPLPPPPPPPSIGELNGADNLEELEKQRLLLLRELADS